MDMTESAKLALENYKAANAVYEKDAWDWRGTHWNQNPSPYWAALVKAGELALNAGVPEDEICVAVRLALGRRVLSKPIGQGAA